MENVMAYVSASKFFFYMGNIKLAYKYWSKIYKVFDRYRVPFQKQQEIMRNFTDDEVYEITDYGKEQYYASAKLPDRYFIR